MLWGYLLFLFLGMIMWLWLCFLKSPIERVWVFRKIQWNVQRLTGMTLEFTYHGTAGGVGRVWSSRASGPGSGGCRAGGWYLVDLRFSIMKSWKNILYLSSAPIQCSLPADLSDCEMGHTFTPPMGFEKKRMRPLLSLPKGSRGDHVRIKTSSSSILPGLGGNLSGMTEMPSQAFTNKEALFIMWGFFFFLSRNSLWLNRKLQNHQRAPNHPSEFILRRVFILIFSFH